jgi:hypothetical protein
MASTETRSGFRLPWSTDRPAAVDTEGVDDAAPAETTQPIDQVEAPESETSPEMLELHAAPDTGRAPEAIAEGDAAPAVAHDEPAPASPEAHEPSPAPSDAAEPPVRPTKFLADLTRAMRATAEAERAELVGGLQERAKGCVETVRNRATSGATEIRTAADDDIVGIREWSKAEIARIRDETERRIADRRSDLEAELQHHAASVEREVERVNDAVAAYEASMARFFEALIAEDDPSRFAAMAANLPAPPDLDDVVRGIAKVEPPAAPVEPAATGSGWPTDDDAMPTVATPTAEAATDGATTEATLEPDAASATGTEDAGATTMGASVEPEADPEAEAAEVDPRVAALGLTPDFASAEAEALAAAGSDDGSDDADGPMIDDDTIAARLSGLGAAPVETAKTQLVVTGLMSVASIAGFKRQVAGISGVRSVGVSSGPDGEFVYAVEHDATVSLGDAIPTLHGFAARVTGTGDGVVSVAARDPESDA